MFENVASAWQSVTIRFFPALKFGSFLLTLTQKKARDFTFPFLHLNLQLNVRRRVLSFESVRRKGSELKTPLWCFTVVWYVLKYFTT